MAATMNNGVPRQLGAIPLTEKEQDIVDTLAHQLIDARHCKRTGKLIFEIDIRDGGIIDCMASPKFRVGRMHWVLPAPG